MDSNVDLLQSSFFCAVGWAPGLERKGVQKKKKKIQDAQLNFIFKYTTFYFSISMSLAVFGIYL